MRQLIASCAAAVSIFGSSMSAAAPLVPEDLGVVPGESDSSPSFINGEGRVTGHGGGRVNDSGQIVDAAWAGTCRQLVLRLIDGTVHRANFQLK